MASHGQQTIETPEPPDFAGAKFVEYEEFIESQLRKTRSHVRGVDIATGILVLVAGTLAWFFVAAMIDHWVITGGLGFWGRVILLAVFLIAAGWWTATQILPLLIKRINPLYAAQTIERSRPSLKNSLVNFLLFRSDPAGVHRRVFEAIEEQAATSLVGVPIESAVDRTRLVRLGYLLVGIVAVCAVYALVSPKNLFQTFGRVAMPWADINPPTRTTIDEIEPGHAQAFRGQQVTVKARVQGLPGEGKVVLYYTTADRQIVDRPVEMSLPPEDYRHVAVLPAGDAALQQSLTYRIEAGDARTVDFAIDVVAAPTMVVRAVEYKYPEYTGLLARRVEHQGDLKAIEGTQVTLEALANQDIASAYVDFDCDDTLDLPLRGEGTAAKASFRLALADDRQQPEHASYQLTFKNAAGQRNPQPVKHQIEVTRDVSPEIQFVAPNREEIELPLDGAVVLELVAIDPDFALASVKLSAVKGNDTVIEVNLLNETWRGQFVKKYRFQPGKLKLAVGDTVEYFAVAVDNKSPRPNQTETSRRRIRIVSPSGRGDDQLVQKEPTGGEPGEGEPQTGQGREGDQPRDAQADEQNKSEQGQPGDEQSPESSGEPQNSDETAQPQGQPEGGQESKSKGASAGKDGGSQQGDKGQQAGDGESGDGEQGAGSAGEQEGEAGEAQSGSGKSGSKQSDGSKPGGEQSGGDSGSESASGEQSGGEQSVPSDGTNDGDAFERILKHREEQRKQNPAGDQQQSGQQKGGGQSGDQNPPNGEQPAGEKQSPQDKQSGQQPGDQQNAEQSGKRPMGGDKQGGQSAGSEKSEAQDGAGQKQEPTGKPDDKSKQGQEKPGDKSQPGDKSRQGDQSQQGSGAKQDQQPGEDSPANDEKGQSESGDKQGQQSGKKQSPGEKSGAGAQDKQQPSEQQPGKDGQSPQSDAQPGGQQDNNTSPDGTPQKPDTQGQGAQAKDDPMRKADQRPQQSDQQRPDAKGGDGEQQKGESGAGQKSNENQGSPHAQDSNQPRDKSQQPSQNQEQQESKESQEQSPSNSKRESDSESSEDGDRSGGGKRGGGQKSNQPGTGGAGQNTAADEGAGQSEESGDGETSDRAGDDQEAAGKTGQSGSKQGSGSLQQSSSGEQQQAGGEQSSDEEQGEPPTEPSGDAHTPGGGGAQGGERQSGKPPGPGAAPEQAWKPGVDSADKANLEYTRQATDLALEHLRHELGKDQPDQALLDRLGWTREQAEDFVTRWEAMRKNAQAPEQRDSSGRRQLDDALRSLGLRPRGATLGSNAKRDDRSQGYRESHRTTPPPEYSEAFKAYTQGTSRGGK